MNAAVDDPRPSSAGILQSDTSVVAGTRRLVALDALRGIAIGLVIVHHVWFQFPDAQSPGAAKFVAGIGWAGVDLFFAISGFLITSILLRLPVGSSLWPFYIKRFFRIVPIYMVAVGLYFIVAVALGHDYEVIHRIWINLALLTAWAIPFLGESGVPYTITWSVSVEEFAYILFGALLLVNRAKFAILLRWVVFIALALRILSIVIFAMEPISLYYFAPGRVDAIAMGGVAATLSPRLARRISAPVWIPWSIWVGVLALCSFLKRENALVATVGYTAIAFASAWLVLCVVSRAGNKSWPVTRWLADFGLVSYFIYLFHGFVIGALAQMLPSGSGAIFGVWLLSLVVALVTYLAAKVSWRVFEYPLISRGRRLADRYQVIER